MKGAKVHPFSMHGDFGSPPPWTARLDTFVGRRTIFLIVQKQTQVRRGLGQIQSAPHVYFALGILHLRRLLLLHTFDVIQTRTRLLVPRDSVSYASILVTKPFIPMGSF